MVVTDNTACKIINHKISTQDHKKRLKPQEPTRLPLGSLQSTPKDLPTYTQEVLVIISGRQEYKQEEQL